jgi:hypothetical protein
VRTIPVKDALARVAERKTLPPAESDREKELSEDMKDRAQCSDGRATYSRESSDPLEPLNAETFSRRLNSLSQAVNTMEEFHRALVSQHPRYGKRLPDIS